MMPENCMKESGYLSVKGLKRGVVTDLKDPEGLNRVKVRFIDEDIEMPYANVMAYFAGKNCGSVCIPSKNEEVLVGFLDGQINNPVILGGLYNSKNHPPIKVDEKNEKMVIKLSTGLEIEIDSNKDNSNISLTTQHGHIVKLEDGKSQTVLLKEKQGKTSFQVDFSKGTIELNADKKISMKAGNGGASFEIDGQKGFILNSKSGNFKLDSKSMAICASTNFTVSAKGNSTIKSTGKATLQSNSVTAIKGAATVKIN